MPRSPSTGSKTRPIRLIITTGDVDGIGWEVSQKALTALGPRAGVQFAVYRAAASKRPGFPAAFKRRRVTHATEAAGVPFDPSVLIEIADEAPPARWVEDATRACLARQFDALVTAPLSKTGILAAGLKDIGHTEILARLSGARDLTMGFIGAKFAVVLASGHRPLARAVTEFDEAQLRRAIAAARQLRASLPAARRARPLAVVGMNPHAGEEGLLGREETWFRRVIAEFPDVEGPLVPDAAFLPKFWPRYSVWISPYHDQGLIPFKLIHGFTGGVHLTLGLPFVRSSVDHGTAKDLFGKNQAHHGSMKDAILTAVRLAKETPQ